MKRLSSILALVFLAIGAHAQVLVQGGAIIAGGNPNGATLGANTFTGPQIAPSLSSTALVAGQCLTAVAGGMIVSAGFPCSSAIAGPGFGPNTYTGAQTAPNFIVSSLPANQCVTTTSGGQLSTTGAPCGGGPSGSFALNQYEMGQLLNTGGTVLGHTNAYTTNGITTQVNLNALFTSLGSGNIVIPAGYPHIPFSNPNGIHVLDERSDVRAYTPDVKEWGAQCDTVQATGTIISGSTTLNLTGGYTFTSADAGDSSGAGPKQIEMVGSVSGVPTRFTANITAVTTGAQATISTPAPFTSTAGASIVIGHPDDASVAAAFAYVAGSNESIEIPQGANPPGASQGLSGCWVHAVRLYGQTFHGLGQTSIMMGHAGEDVIKADDPSQTPYTGQSRLSAIYNLQIWFDARINAAQPWQDVGPTGTTTQHAATYRPAGVLTAWSNFPLAPGWFIGPGINGSGTIIGAGAVSNGGTGLTIATGSSTYPANGQQVVFPTSSSGVFTTTVASGGGTANIVLNAPFPGTSTAQIEFFAGTSVQNIQTAIPTGSARTATITAFSITGNVVTVTATNGFAAGQKVNISGLTIGTYLNGAQLTVISTGLSGAQFEAAFTYANVGPTTDAGTASIFPFQLTLANSIIPSTLYESNVAPFGMVQIDNERFSYFQTSAYPASTSTSQWIELTAGAQMTTSAAIHSVGATIVPVNPFQNLPWPVTPTINGAGNQTPAGAEFFPAYNVGNAGLSFAEINGSATVFGGSFFTERMEDVTFFQYPVSPENPVSYQLQNSTAGMYFVLYPFDSHFSRITITNPFFGVVTGGPSYNTHNFLASYPPTGDATTWRDIVVQSACVPLSITWGGTNSIDNWQSFSQCGGPPGTSWPGYTPKYSGGGTVWAFTGNYDDTVDSIPHASSMHDTVISGMYIEYENGALANLQPQFQIDLQKSTWTGNGDEGISDGYIGGIFNTFQGPGPFNANAALPVVNYGYGNKFQGVAGLGKQPLSGVWGVGTLVNWGYNTFCSGISDNIFGSPAGAYENICLGSQAQPGGQTAETFGSGNLSPTYTNTQSGLIYPFELANSTGFGVPGLFQDPTEPVSGSMAACVVPAGNTDSGVCNMQNINVYGLLPIGPGLRLVPTKYVVSLDTKQSTGSAQTFGLAFYALNCSAATRLYVNHSVPVSTTWTPQSLGVIDLTPYSGCDLGTTINGSSTTPTTIEIGFEDWYPEPANYTVQQITDTGLTAGCLQASGTGVISSTGTSCGSGSGSGSVTSVGLTVPTWLAVTPGTITTAGTFAVTAASVAQNLFLASPNGSAGGMNPRAITAADIPTLNQNTTGQSNTTLAFATNPSNCPAGQVSAGIAANGSAEGCVIVGSGNTTSTSLTTNYLSLANGANSIVNSYVQQSGNSLVFTPPGGSTIVGSGTASNVDGWGELTLSAATTVTYTFINSYGSHPECHPTPQFNPGTGNSPWITYTGVASFTINFATAVTGSVSYHCDQRN